MENAPKRIYDRQTVKNLLMAGTICTSLALGGLTGKIAETATYKLSSKEHQAQYDSYRTGRSMGYSTLGALAGLVVFPGLLMFPVGAFIRRRKTWDVTPEIPKVNSESSELYPDSEINTRPTSSIPGQH